MNIYNLENCFNRAIEVGAKYVAVSIGMGGFKEEEIIINPIENAVDKLAYYKQAYFENLNHRFSQDITITGFTYGNSLAEIEEDLISWGRY
jgi:hypothetical protein